MVSVTVCTFNRPRFLARLLDSIAAQTYRDFEVIVVNDGGMDVRDVVAVDRGFPVTLLDNEVNRGRPYTLNRGVFASTGKYFTVIADDDLFYPNRLDLTVGTLERLGPGHALYTSAVQVLEDGDGNPLSSRPAGENAFDQDMLMVANIITSICTLIPTETMQRLGGFDPTLRVMVDWEMWIRVSQELQWVFLPIVTGEHRLRDQRRDNVTNAERHYYRSHVEYIYNKFPVPAGSDLECRRAKMLAEYSKPETSERSLVATFVVRCRADPGALETTLVSLIPYLRGDLASFEILILVPDAKEWSGLAYRPTGAFHLCAIGDVSDDEAWAFGSWRSNGRHVLNILAGEEIDPLAIEAALREPVGTAARVGRQPAS